MAGAKRGRTKKTIEDRKAEGTYRPERHGASFPTSEGKPVKPRYLKGEAGKFWGANVPRLADLGIACDVDTPALAAMCEWWAEYRQAVDEAVENENAIKELAKQLGRVVDLARDGVVGDEIDAIANEALRATAALVDKRSMQAKRRADRMAKSWREFLAIAGRFGLTAIDRRAMRDVDPGSNADDPIERMLAVNRGLSVYEDEAG